MMKPKMRSKAMIRYARTVFRAIKAATTADERKKIMAEYHYAADHAAAAWAGILPVRRTGYRCISIPLYQYDHGVMKRHGFLRRQAGTPVGDVTFYWRSSAYAIKGGDTIE